MANLTTYRSDLSCTAERSMRKQKQTTPLGANTARWTGLRGWLSLSVLAAAVATMLWSTQPVSAIGKSSQFQWAKLVFPGSSNNRPTALRRLLWVTTKRTSIRPKLNVAKIKVQDPKLSTYPLLYIAGETGFPAWPQKDVVRLRSHLSSGGTLFLDMTGGDPGGPFDRSVRRLAKRLFPKNAMKKLSRKHTLYRSFYLIRRFGGRRLLQPYIEGVTRDDRTPLIYSLNDHSGAWERDNFGHWVYPVVPGGDSQREHSFRFGINIIMYALCVNYKQDGVHIPFIMQRRQ